MYEKNSRKEVEESDATSYPDNWNKQPIISLYSNINIHIVIPVEIKKKNEHLSWWNTDLNNKGPRQSHWKLTGE